MTGKTNTDWIREGAQVAAYHFGNPNSVSFATVARLTATQIVLDNDSRYRRDNLRAVGEKRGAWGGWTELRPVDDGMVRDTAAEQVLQNLHNKIDRLGRTERRGRDGALAALDEIEKAIAAARQAIK